MKQVLKKPFLLIFLTVFFSSLQITPKLFAATPAPAKTVTISPFLQEVRFAGTEASKDFKLTLTNTTKLSHNFELSALDFGSLDDTGGIVFEGSNASSLVKKYGLATWLKISATSVRIAAGKSAEVLVTIVNDNTMQPGGHYAAIVASLDNDRSGTGIQVSVNQQISALILATKTGGEKYDLKLDKTEIRYSRFSLPKKVTLHFSNPGNVHVIPRGLIRIISAKDKLLSQGVINDASSFVLPETSRKIEIELNQVAKPGIFPATYRLEVNYRYDGYDNYATKTFTFHYINLPALILLGTLVLLVIAASVFIVIRLKRRAKKSKS